MDNDLDVSFEGFDLTDPNRFFLPNPPVPTCRPTKSETSPPPAATRPIDSNKGALVLYRDASRNPAYSAILADPVNALFTLCHQRHLPAPQFFSKKLSGTRARPLGLHGMEVLVNGTRKSTAMDYDTQKEAEEAAALLGLQVLGVPVHLRSQHRTPKSPTHRKQPAKEDPTPRKTRFQQPNILDAMEPNLGTMGNTYFHALQRLLHRHYMLMPKLKHEALSSFPPRHLILFEFYGQRFEAIDGKKADARQLACKRAYEYFSKHPDFASAPVDYREKLAAIARAKKWHSPKFFDPSNGTSTSGIGEMGVIIQDFEFIEKWPPELSSTGAKQLVAKKAFEYLSQMEQRTLPNVSKRLPLTCSVSQVGQGLARAPSSPFMKSRFSSGNQPSVRKHYPQADMYGAYAQPYVPTFSSSNRHTTLSPHDYDDHTSADQGYPPAYYGSSSERDFGMHTPCRDTGVPAYDENDLHYYNLLDPHFDSDSSSQSEGDSKFVHGYDSTYPTDNNWNEMPYPHLEETMSEHFPSRVQTGSKARFSPNHYDEEEFISSHYTY